MNFLYTDEDEFNTSYVLKIKDDENERYFFTPRLFVRDVSLAHKFNTIRSVKRAIKLSGVKNYEIIKIKN
ncbi:MAG: hypothetical protein IKU87_02765 [Clostridia bacterium]|nr:hypothetical protein [Clostridia bacterium]